MSSSVQSSPASTSPSLRVIKMESAVRAWGAGGKPGGVENLDAVLGPFAVAGGLVRRSQDDAAFGAQFVEENTSGEVIRIGRGSWRRGGVIGGNEKQVRIAGIDADGVGFADLEAGAVDILEERSLRDFAVVRDPVCVLQVGSEENVRVDPAL